MGAFTTPLGQAMVNDAERPSWAVAHDESLVRATLAATGLDVVHFYPGRWASEGIQEQDLMIAIKASAVR